MKTNVCLIWSIEHSGWWKPGEMGYTKVKAEAGFYSLEHAEEICTKANRYTGDSPHEAIVPVE